MRDDIVREFIMIRQDSKPNTEKRAVCYSRLKKKIAHLRKVRARVLVNRFLMFFVPHQLGECRRTINAHSKSATRDLGE